MSAIRLFSLALLSFALFFAACQPNRPASTACSPEMKLLETIGIAVSPEENREFSFTDKRSGYLYGTTHSPFFDNWFAGWNVNRKRVLKDYELTVDGQVLNRQEAAVTVFPHLLRRTFPQATESLTLFDDISAIGIRLENVRGKTAGIRITGDLCRFQEADGNGLWFVPGEAPDQRILLTSWKASKLSVRDSSLSAPAAAGGFLLIAGANKSGILDTLALLRAQADQLLEQRRCRMEALAAKAHPHSGQDSLDQALIWLSLTLDQLITRQLGWGIYAGLPWFNDYWGRDMFISLPGACLVNGQFEVARKILLSFVQFQDRDTSSRYYGRIPNRARPDDIIYNTADGTPRFVAQIYDYARYSGDTAIIRELYPAVRRSIEGALRYWMDDKGYLTHDDADTWMDAKIKGKVPWSPRGNRANDLQALWVQQLEAGAAFAAFVGDTASNRQWEALAGKVRSHFAQDFILPKKGYLADRLSPDGKPDPKMRPNQLFAYELLRDDSLKHSITKTVWQQLVYPWGVASLSQMDPDFHPYHENWNYYHKDAAYHNGTVWLWNNGIAMQRMIEAGQTELAWQLFRNMNRQALTLAAVGSLSENADALPRPGALRGKPSGTFLQAWSNAEHLRVWYQYFLGVRPDMPANVIQLQPRLPGEIKALDLTLSIGKGALQMVYSAAAEGREFSYTLNHQGATLDVDLPGFPVFQRKLAAGDMLWIREAGQRLSVEVRRKQKVLEHFDLATDPARLAAIRRLEEYFRGTTFCQPYLQPNLKCLSVYHDPPLTY